MERFIFKTRQSQTSDFAPAHNLLPLYITSNSTVPPWWTRWKF